MNKKNEQKILEELRKRVLEKDRELKERSERENLIDSNKEALAEMTNLSRTEVDKIEKQLRRELQAKIAKQNKRRTWIIAAIVIVGFIAFRIVMKQINKEPPAPAYHFIETFDNNDNHWDIFNKFEVKRNIKDGAYTFVGNKDDWCFWDDLELELPNSYSIELKTKWQRGSFDEYGLMLMQDSKNYYTFVIRADGKTANAIYQLGSWVKRNSWKTVDFKTDEIITQKLEVRNNNFTYYVNGNKYANGKLDKVKVSKIALRVCDKQTINFRELNITNLNTNEAIFTETFDKNSGNWDEKQDVTKVSTIEHGKYTFTTNDEDQCYWAVSSPNIKLPTSGSSKYSVRVKMTWIKGEESNFGFMLLESDNNYVAFQAMSSGDARSVTSSNGEYVSIPEYTSTGIVGDGKTPIEMLVKVNNNDYEYFLNNKLIQTGNFNYKDITYIALRVCGRQTIAFDEIEIIEEED